MLWRGETVGGNFVSVYTHRHWKKINKYFEKKSIPQSSRVIFIPDKKKVFWGTKERKRENGGELEPSCVCMCVGWEKRVYNMTVSLFPSKNSSPGELMQGGEMPRANHIHTHTKRRRSWGETVYVTFSYIRERRTRTLDSNGYTTHPFFWLAAENVRFNRLFGIKMTFRSMSFQSWYDTNIVHFLII